MLDSQALELRGAGFLRPFADEPVRYSKDVDTCGSGGFLNGGLGKPSVVAEL